MPDNNTSPCRGPRQDCREQKDNVEPGLPLWRLCVVTGINTHDTNTTQHRKGEVPHTEV